MNDPGHRAGVALIIVGGLFIAIWIHGRASRQPSTLRQVVGNAHFVWISWPPSPPGGPARGVANVDQLSPNLLKLFNNSKGFRSTPPERKPDLVVRVQETLTKPIRRFEYVSATGELGSDKEWCVVTEEFRTWVLHKMKTAPPAVPMLYIPGGRDRPSVVMPLTLTSGSNAKKSRQDRSLRQIVGGALFVSIDWPPSQPGGLARRVANLHPRSPNLKLFNTSKGFRSTPPTRGPDLVFVVREALTKPFYRYDYVSVTGELGAGMEWCIVPAEFRTWVLHKMKTAPPAVPVLNLGGPGGIPVVQPFTTLPTGSNARKSSGNASVNELSGRIRSQTKPLN